MAMKIVEQSRKLIKPATPTPLNLRRYKISFTDELNPPINISIVLFFSANNINHQNLKFVTQLEKSLEKTLPRFYPLAGRYLKEIHVVDCNDQGVEFIHAKSNIKLQDIVRSEANLRLVEEFIPSQLGAVDQVTNPVLSIQVTKLECEGLAVGVSMSHKIADAATFCTFLNEWSVISREEKEVEFTRLAFNSSTFFPARGLTTPPIIHPNFKTDDAGSKVVTKIFSFSNIEISDLKEKMELNGRKRNGTQQWSKVQVVSALIWNAFIRIDRITHGYPRDSILVQPVNLRGKTGSLMPKDCCGNLCAMLITEGKTVETTEALADLLKDSVTNFIDYCFKIRNDNEEVQTMVLNSYLNLANLPPTTNVFMVSSWCKFPIYEADFGFGKPVWVSYGVLPVKNIAYLLDDVGGNGVETYVGMEEKDVPFFEEALQIN